jgi:hypothetical protein
MKKYSVIIIALLMFNSLIFNNLFSQKTDGSIKIKLTIIDITESTAKIQVESNDENVFFILSSVDKELKWSDQQIPDAPIKVDYSKATKLTDNAIIIGKSNGKKINFEITNMPNKSKFYLQGYKLDNNKNLLVAHTEINTLAPKPTKQASNLAFAKVTDNSMKLIWVNGNGEGRIVVASKGDKLDLPNSSSSFVASNKMGDEKAKIGNSFIVYDGKGKVNSCEINNLSAGKYKFFVIEYNGNGSQRNYLLDQSSTNPRMKATAISAPKALPATQITESSFIANWSSVPDAQSYILQVASDEKFENILELYNSLDVGKITNMEVIELEKGKTYYYRVQVKGDEGVSGFSNTIKVDL